MVTVIATLKAQPGKESELLEICTGLAKVVHATEEGCLAFKPYVAKDDPTEIVFFEQYKTKEDFKLHSKTTHFKEAFSKIPSLLAAPPQAKFLSEI